MNVALDTNVIAYAVGLDDAERQSRALYLTDQLPPKEIVLPAQLLAEFFRLLVGKARLPNREAAQMTRAWATRYAVHGTSPEITFQSIDLATDHSFTIWDAIVLATAANAGCRVLLSEDMQHGFTWSGVTIVNPFELPMHPLLEQALNGG